jgi:hypothetical protein
MRLVGEEKRRRMLNKEKDWWGPSSLVLLPLPVLSFTPAEKENPTWPKVERREHGPPQCSCLPKMKMRLCQDFATSQRAQKLHLLSRVVVVFFSHANSHRQSSRYVVIIIIE